MKISDLTLNEAKIPKVLETKEQIDDWLKKRSKRIDGTWEIDDELRVTIHGNVDLTKMKMSRLPVNFKEVTGRFSVSNSSLETLEGCPEKVGKFFNCSYTLIKNLIGGPKFINTSKSEHETSYYANNNDLLESLEGVAENAEELNVGFCKKLERFDFLPKRVRRITACATGIKTLVGIDKIAKRLESLQINSSPVEEGALCLMNIPSFKMRSFIYRTGNEDTDLGKAGDILSNVDAEGGDIFDAQNELLDANLDAMAKL